MEVEMAKCKPKRTAHNLLEDTRTAMEEIAAKLLFLKKEARPKSEMKELITNTSLLFIALRQVNRAILLEEDRVKSETEGAKAPVDLTTLQLHNLMYEKNHYLKAIKACKDFKSKFPDIDLVPEQDFFTSAPEDIKGKTLADDPAHDLMMKRLNFELFQRKELCKHHETLEQRKRSLLETIANRKKFLSSLPSHLKSLKKASLPVQQHFGILHTKKLKQHHAAELLPPPLYIAYSQLLAQKEAFGERIELEIVGSIKDAQTSAHQRAPEDDGTLMNAENSRLEDEAPDDEEDGQRRRKRPKKSVFKDSIDQSGIYRTHPLRVVLLIYDNECSEPNPSKLIALKFEYLAKLNVICVGIEDAGDGCENILCNLFPDDTGMELPHQTAKLYAGDAAFTDENKTSRPYKWAQHLGGIDFLQELPPLHGCSEIPSSEVPKGGGLHSGLSLYRQQNRVQTVVKRIRSRKKAQMALLDQLDSLRKLKLPTLMYEGVPWASHTPSCTLESWSELGLIVNSSSSIVTRHDPERRSATPWEEETENAREDGELPVAPLAPSPLSVGSDKNTPNGFSELDHSLGLALISKCVTPTKMLKSHSFSKHEDELELMVDSESDLEEQTSLDEETEDASLTNEKPWKDHAVREFHLILSKKNANERIVKLEAEVKISIEYPLRPPFFSLSLSSNGSHGCGKQFNELRAMESEVNLHILKILPLECEKYILSHQVHCLAMLFDFHFDTQNDKRGSTSVIDVGLCKPVSGTLISRFIRGRDRRKMLSWKGMHCIPGYPC